MKKLLFITLLSIAFAGEKVKPVYTKRADELKKLETRANQIIDEKKKVQTYIDNLDKEMLVIQGQYTVYQSMPDSFIVRPDSLRTK